MNNKRFKPAVYLGIFAIALGLIANKWTMEVFFSPDGHFESSKSVLLIIATQLILIGVGTALLIKKPRLQFLSRHELVLIAASTLFAFALVEIAMRIWLSFFSTPVQFQKYSLYTDIPTESIQWSRHHYLNYYATPNFRNGLTFHNSLGYRSKEFDPEKPANTYRIVTLGGSTTYTISVADNEKTFPNQLEKVLRNEYGYENAEVINAGVGGYNSWESLINLQIRVLDINPDLVIVYHGTNDVHTRLVLPDAYKGDNSGRVKQWSPTSIPVAEHSVLLRVILRKLGLSYQIGLGAFVDSPTFVGVGSPEWTKSTEHSVDILKENPPKYFKRNLVNMASIARANGVNIILSTWAHSPNFDDYSSTNVYQVGYRENNQAVREVAAEHEVNLFDFSEVMPKDKMYWHDGRHVNEDGALLKAQLFAEHIHQSGLIESSVNVDDE